MSYDPNQPYGQQPSDPYGQPASPYGQPSSGTPYNQPQSGTPYNQPQSGSPYDQPQSGSPYDQPASGSPYGQPSSGVPYGQPPQNPTAPLPGGDPYANPTSGAYGNPSSGAYGADPYAQPQAAYGAPGGFPPPAPPKKSKTGWIVGGIIAVAVIIIAVCSIGGWLVSQSDTDDTADPKPTSQVTGAPTLGASSAPPASPEPSIDTSRPEVAPAGAPFTTRLPVGFQEVKAPSSETTGASSEYTAALATSSNEANDFVILDSYTLPADTSTISDSRLEAEFDGLVKKIGQDPATRKNVTYNGYKGYSYTFDFGTAKAYSYFMFDGTKEIQVRCQWADQEQQIKTGCEYVLNNLTID